MKKDRYVVFGSVELAEAFVSQLDLARGSNDRWDTPTIHPTTGQAVVGWCDDYLAPFKSQLEGQATLMPAEAQHQGWQFHAFFKGKFAKVRMKLEEAQLLFDGLKEWDGKTNVPVLRALFFGFTSALYAVGETMKATCAAGDEKVWWKDTEQALKQHRVTGALHQLNSADKHKLSGSPLGVTAKYFGAHLPAFPGAISISAEGAFGIADAGTKRERRIPLPGSLVHTTVQVTALDGAVLGDVSSVCATALAKYEDAVFEARQRFER